MSSNSSRTKELVFFPPMERIFEFERHTMSFHFRDADAPPESAAANFEINAVFGSTKTKYSGAFWAAIAILKAWSPEDRYYYLCRGLDYAERKGRTFSFFHKDRTGAHKYEVTMCFMPSYLDETMTKMLCVFIDKIGEYQHTDVILKQIGLQIDRRQTHIEYDTNAFA